MIWCCCGTPSPGISSRHNLRFQGLGTDARTLPPSKTFFEIYAKPPGTKRFSATPDSMRTREKSFNPLQIGSKLPLKCAKRQARGPNLDSEGLQRQEQELLLLQLRLLQIHECRSGKWSF